jgi:hypothetical protein
MFALIKFNVICKMLKYLRNNFFVYIGFAIENAILPTIASVSRALLSS